MGRDRFGRAEGPAVSDLATPAPNPELTAADAGRRQGLRGLVADNRILTFGVLVVGLTGAIMAASLGKDTTPFGLVLVPATAAIMTAALADGRAGVGRLFSRIVRWRVAPRWYLAAIGVPVVASLLITVLGLALGVGPNTGATGVAFIVPLIVLLPGLLEEFGWRGYGVPSGPRDWPVAAVALGIGVLFLIPHVPLYLPGHIYENLPVWPLPLTILGGSVLMTWVHVGSGGSSLLAGLTHAASNGATPLTWAIDTTRAWELRGVVFALVGILLIVTSSTLRRPLQDVLEDLEPER
jgi:membrane protease YdiL (CAAX protease family)